MEIFHDSRISNTSEHWYFSRCDFHWNVYTKWIQENQVFSLTNLNIIPDKNQKFTHLFEPGATLVDV